MLTLLLLPITIVLLLGGSWLAFYDPGRGKVRRRLRALASGGYADQATAARAVVRPPRVLSDIPWFNTLLVRISLTRTLARLLEQANSPYGLGVVLLLSLLLFCIGFLLSPLVLPNALLHWLGTIFLGLTPLLYLYYRKTQRIRKFEQQLPEALDLVARSLKAGQPFLVGMRMVGDEFADPIGMEFNKTVDEINFGVGVPEALTSLAQRVDCPDLLFFVTSVIVQREVGGNLAEILEKTSHLIRQRFELQGRIQVLAAEGKLSAIILFALPFTLALMINFLNPSYLAVLFTDPVGKGMVTYASITMVMGALVIRKMIKIKV